MLGARESKVRSGTQRGYLPSSFARQRSARIAIRLRVARPYPISNWLPSHHDATAETTEAAITRAIEEAERTTAGPEGQGDQGRGEPAGEQDAAEGLTAV